MSATQSSIFDSLPAIGLQHPCPAPRGKKKKKKGACDPLATKLPNSEATIRSIVGAARVDPDSASNRRRRNGPGTVIQRPLRPSFIRTAFGVLRNKEDAEDALQDCWLSVCTNLKSFEGRSSVLHMVDSNSD